MSLTLALLTALVTLETLPNAEATPAVTTPAAGTPAVGRLQGRVLVKGRQQALPGVALIVDGAELALTDEDGAFSAELACGAHKLSLQSPASEPLELTVDACAPDAGPLNLRLVPVLNAPGYQTIVRAKTPQPAVRLTAEELVQAPGTLGDPVRAIEALPGVSPVLWPASIYAIRGSNPGNTGFFLDGVRVPALFHLALGPSVIHPYFFKSVDFYPGSYPARFGRYVGGIVSAETRPPSTDALHASIDVRLFDAGGMVSAPLAGGAIAVAARYSYAGALLSAFDDKLRLGYWDYQLRADRRVGPLVLSVLAFGSSDAYSPDRADSARDVNLGFHRLKLRALAAIGGGALEGSLVLGKDHSRAAIFDMYPFLVDALSLAPRLSFTRSFGPVAAVVGFDGEIATYDPVVKGGPTQPQPDVDWDFAKHRNVKLWAGYLSATATATRWLAITPEVRFDVYDVNGTRAHDLGPRLALTLALDEMTEVRLTAGRFTQLPAMPLQIPGAEAFGLRRLGLQSTWQGSAGVETEHVPTVKLGATVYAQRGSLSELHSPSDNDPDPLSADFMARREALAYGLELIVRRPATERLHGWISYTLSHSQRSYGGGAVGPSNWDQRHVLNLVLGYRLGRTTIGGRVHFHSGRPFFLNDFAGDEYIRLPPYYQVDLRVDRPFYFDRFTLNLYAELVNATLNHQEYGYSQGLREDLEKHRTRIVLPSVGIRAEL